jgi:hypothetical protein
LEILLSNIKAEDAYDPFPKTGLVKQYEPFIRKQVGEFCERYPRVSRDDALIEAVKIAVEFEPKFNPELGYDFSTPLRWHLKGLKRILVDDEQDYNKRLIHANDGEVSDELAKRVEDADAAMAEYERRAAEETLEALPVTGGNGGNGTRFRFDLNSVVVGCQIYSKVPAVKFAKRFDYARDVIDGLSADLRTLIGFGSGRPTLSGRMRAVVAHADRRRGAGSRKSAQR